MELEIKRAPSSTVGLDGDWIPEAEMKGRVQIEDKCIWPHERRHVSPTGASQSALAEAVQASSGRIADLLRCLRELELRQARRAGREL
jgi:hypothetical protein